MWYMSTQEHENPRFSFVFLEVMNTRDRNVRIEVVKLFIL